MTDDGSESSCCEEVLQCQSEMSSDAACHSGASSDAGVANSDSGINTDPTPNSGSNSPPLTLSIAQASESVELPNCDSHCDQSNISCDPQQSKVYLLSSNDKLVISSTNEENVESAIDKLTRVAEERSVDEALQLEEVFDSLSAGEDDTTSNLCAKAPEFSSQESTLSCLSTPSVVKKLIPESHENAISNSMTSQEKEFVNCQTTQEEVTDSTLVDCEEPLQSDKVTLQTSVVPSDVEIEDLVVHEEGITGTSVRGVDHTVEDEPENLFEEAEIEQIPEVPEEQTTVSHIGLTECEVSLSNVIPAKSYAEENEVSLDQEVIDSPVLVVVPEPEITTKSCTNLESSSSIETEPICTRFPPCTETIAPVPPPRRKRSMCRAADKLASKIVEDAIREGLEEAANIQMRSPLTITEAVTRWLHSQGSSPLTCPLSDSEEEDVEEQENSTGPKNVYGNPFPASYRSERVAKDSESVESTMSAGEWDLWDSRTRDMCDPARSVDKYYRLGADDGAGDLPPSIYKTAMHIRHTGPFPCGVCCIIQ